MKLLKLMIMILSSAYLFSCTTTQNTFQPVWQTELDIKPDRLLAIDANAERIFGAEAGQEQSENTTTIGFKNYKATYLDGETGKSLWTENMNSLGAVEKDPDHIEIIWDERVALFFSKGLSKFKLSAVDMDSKKELWNIEEGNPNKFENTAIYSKEANGIIIVAPEGLRFYDLQTGKLLWTRDDLVERDSFIKQLALEKEKKKAEIDWTYIEPLDRFLISDVNNNLLLMDPYTGKNDWIISENLGSVMAAKIFEDEGKAIFFGPELKSAALEILQRESNIVGKVMDVVNEVPKAIDLILVDLKTGEVDWKSKVFSKEVTNDVRLLEDKVILSNNIFYALDRETGEVLWQSVDKDRLKDEQFLTALSSTTFLDFKAHVRNDPEPIITDDAVVLVFPEIYEDIENRHRVTIRKYDLETGELLWKSNNKRFYPQMMFHYDDKIFIKNSWIDRFMIDALDPESGERVYEIRDKGRAVDVFPKDDRIYRLQTRGFDAYDVEDGNKIDLPEELTKSVIAVEDVGDGFLAIHDAQAEGKKDYIALHDYDDFEIERKAELPVLYNDYYTIGNKLFMTNNKSGIVAVDLDEIKVNGYIITKNQGVSTINGKDQIERNYVLEVSENGEYIMELNKKLLTKYSVD